MATSEYRYIRPSGKIEEGSYSTGSQYPNVYDAQDAGEFAAISHAHATYLSVATASGSYLKKADASATYLSDADYSGYMTEADASANYLKKTSASGTYMKTATASGTYLKKADASGTYAKDHHEHWAGSPPAAHDSSGSVGEMSLDASGNLYLCTADNTWVKFAIASDYSANFGV
jgi:uncharacterized protein YjbI with pentapeptide repeats